MTKAEQVRKNRLAAVDKGMDEAAKQIFEWMLDIINDDTEAGVYNGISFLLYDDVCKLEALGHFKEYDLSPFLEKYERRMLFAHLKKVIESEDGYDVDYICHTTEWDSPCLEFTVTIH